MPREHDFYRDNLEQILQFSGGRQLLTVTEVCSFTGIRDTRTARAHFPFRDKFISAATLARCLCEGHREI